MAWVINLKLERTPLRENHGHRRPGEASDKGSPMSQMITFVVSSRTGLSTTLRPNVFEPRAMSRSVS
jgi:hypothetical protein